MAYALWRRDQWFKYRRSESTPLHQRVDQFVVCAVRTVAALRLEPDPGPEWLRAVPAPPPPAVRTRRANPRDFEVMLALGVSRRMTTAARIGNALEALYDCIPMDGPAHGPVHAL